MACISPNGPLFGGKVSVLESISSVPPSSSVVTFIGLMYRTLAKSTSWSHKNIYLVNRHLMHQEPPFSSCYSNGEGSLIVNLIGIKVRTMCLCNRPDPTHSLPFSVLPICVWNLCWGVKLLLNYASTGHCRVRVGTGAYLPRGKQEGVWKPQHSKRRRILLSSPPSQVRSMVLPPPLWYEGRRELSV